MCSEFFPLAFCKQRMGFFYLFGFDNKDVTLKTVKGASLYIRKRYINLEKCRTNLKYVTDWEWR